LGNIAFQRATWLDPEMQNPHYSYVEFCECFYDVASGGYHSKDREAPDAPFLRQLSTGLITRNERDTLWEVHLALEGYKEPNGHYDHAAILKDPAWHAVVEIASNAAATLKASLEPTDDLRAFENQIPSGAAKRWP
jgi:hypothetical protein